MNFSPMSFALLVLALLQLVAQFSQAFPLERREAIEHEQHQPMEKRRNAEFINGLLSMERLNAMGKRSPMPPYPTDDDEPTMLWRPLYWAD